LQNFQKYKHNEKLIINKNLSITFITNQHGDHDASIIVTSDQKNYFFQTDNILSLDDARDLSSKFNIDIAFTIPTLTGIYPGFYEFEFKTQKKLAIEKNIRWLNHSLDLMDILKPKFVIPYACDICYLGENFNVNDLHASNKLEYKNVAKSRKSSFKVILMGPNDSIKKLNNSKYEFKLGNHDYEKKFLSSYAIYKRDHHLKYLAIEKKYGVDNLSEEIKTFTRKLSSIKNKWNFNSGFNVQWNIELPDNKIKKFNQSFGDNTNDKLNLLIKIPYYRIQRLVHKDYDMGFLTLQNGSIRCTRKNLNLNKVEQFFWIFMYRNLIF